MFVFRVAHLYLFLPSWAHQLYWTPHILLVFRRVFTSCRSIYRSICVICSHVLYISSCSSLDQRFYSFILFYSCFNLCIALCGIFSWPCPAVISPSRRKAANWGLVPASHYFSSDMKTPRFWCERVFSEQAWPIPSHFCVIFTALRHSVGQAPNSSSYEQR